MSCDECKKLRAKCAKLKKANDCLFIAMLDVRMKSRTWPQSTDSERTVHQIAAETLRRVKEIEQ